jgi:hypothetical protein
MSNFGMVPSGILVFVTVLLTVILQPVHVVIAWTSPQLNPHSRSPIVRSITILPHIQQYCGGSSSSTSRNRCGRMVYNHLSSSVMNTNMMMMQQSGGGGDDDDVNVSSSAASVSTTVVVTAAALVPTTTRSTTEISPTTPTPNETKDKNTNTSYVNSSQTVQMRLQEQMIQVTQPIQTVLDTVSDGWVLSYANLHPDTPQTLYGQLFLFSNVAYFIVGIIVLQVYQDYWFGSIIEVVSVLSYNYHYQQLLDTDRNAVRLSLLLDYMGACLTIGTGFYYLIGPTAEAITTAMMQSTADGTTTTTTTTTFATTSNIVSTIILTQQQSLQFESLIYSIASILFLISSWVWEAGKPYMILHSLWHLCSAYSGYLIGTYHHFVTTTTTIT